MVQNHIGGKYVILKNYVFLPIDLVANIFNNLSNHFKKAK